MRFLVLATDYDGTIAADGKVDDTTRKALEQVRASGRRLLLLTGRHLPDLFEIFPRLEIFDRVIAENGGLLYSPQNRQEKLLCEAPNEEFVSLLRQKNVPFSTGRTIVATWQPHEKEVLDTIRDLGLDLQVIFNKGAVMVLPSGVNKGTGLQAALDELHVSAHNVVSLGDAENDHSFLRLSECSVAVANALPALKERADVVLDSPRGAGVIELCGRLIEEDLAAYDEHLKRHAIALGTRVGGDESPVIANPRAGSILVAGPSASGKSTAVSGILEQLVEHNYQFCLIDPEGDYDGMPGVLTFGSAKEAPDVKAILRALESATQSVLINLLGISVEDRPGFFSSLLPQIQDLRTRYARPHWLVIDEAHHMMPSTWTQVDGLVPQVLETTVLITVHPDHVAKAALNPVEIVMAIGKTPGGVFESLAKVLQIDPPKGDYADLPSGEALVWFRKQNADPVQVKAVRSRRERLRHVRQYAEGELSPEQSFYFRGPQSKLNLRAQNLRTFLQLADGVDDDTWMFHLRNGDYSSWFESMIKDNELSKQVEVIEQDKGSSPQESRQKIKTAVDKRYTAPA